MMDEKIPFAAHEGEESQVRARWSSRSSGVRKTLALLLTALAFFLLHQTWTTCQTHQDVERGDLIRPHKVAFEAHIMSKCPDAKDCLQDLVVPVMANISDKVDFTLSYIGKLTDNDDAVSCMHGPTECLGNILELCAADLYPDPKIYLGFANCMTMKYSLIPQKELIQDCALEHGVDFDKLNDCASDEGLGVDLLRNSVARSANANVTKSCTVRINGNIRCIRDGGLWKDCDGGSTPEDLIRDIKKSLRL